MSNVDWDEYKNDIVAFYEEGLGTDKIAKILAKKNPNIEATLGRSIRQAIERWKDNDNFKIKIKPAKILLFDIETAPLIAYRWSRYPSYIPEGQIIENWYVINWSAKWLFEDKIISEVTTPKENRNRDDERVVRKLWHLLNEADIVIAHYGDKFDIKMMNGRFFKYNMTLPMPYKSIDTKKEAGKVMKLPALNLNFIARYKNLEQKHETNFSLWEGCMAGDKDSLKKMKKYCDQDVKVLEDVYLHLRPYIRSHPNLGLFIDQGSKMCPSCASTNLKKEGRYQTTVNIYDAYRCQDCGSITRNRKHDLPKQHKQNITSGVPR